MATYDFTGKRVLVTGASRGIGASIAERFALAAAHVTILAEVDEVLATAERLTRTTGRAVSALRCDITDRALLIKSIRTLERLDVLVANAGTGDTNSITDAADHVDRIFERLIQINLIGAYNTVRAALPLIGTGGRIIFTSSVHGQSIAPSGMSAYAASKGGVEALMRSLARELGPRGINVNAVAPGMVATELTLGAIRKLFAAQIAAGQPAMAEADMIRELNRGQAIHNRPVDINELADAYLFLASSAGNAITGQSINVDHGLQFK